MIQSAARLLTLLMFGFAVMGFIGVPVLGKTGFEHVQDFLRSKPAQNATAEVGRSLSEVHLKIENELAQRSDEPGPSKNVSESSNDATPEVAHEEDTTLSRESRRDRPRVR